MTKLFQDAGDAARHLPPQSQDEIARMVTAVRDEPVMPMSAEEEASFSTSCLQAARGEFASEARMEAIWSKEF